MSATTASPEPRYDADPVVSYRARVRAAEGAANPLLEAARPLLDALANTPAELHPAGVARYRLWLVQHLRMFGKVCGELRLPAEHIEKARYCLCSALDEAAELTDWGNGSKPGMDWRATGLATTFGHDRQGGDRVYAIATDAMHNQRENRCLIEVIQHILDRGFRGRYLLTLGYARKTLLRHRDHIWMLGGEMIRSRHEDPDRLALPVETLLDELIEEDGGPLIWPAISESEQDSEVAREFRIR
ncbi:DotU/TssL family secretion system protein [Paraburkholderia sacchari]|uniref:Type IV / VI secretion system DotU domain-containing protein n=1 Tax=Paraburkholderia sacchari TaxID=159450 RepID=A0A8T6ZJY0_9BURK|nr:DotU/TssL family secretion system protein [Paraburkholderia sacchari]NLP64912.1 hypothetical protein [Paraburkholderia sacchari]